MDVDKVGFYPRLLQVLEDLSTAHFVSLDFELSGISSRQPGGGRQKQTLQERYAETKEAAERYRILQIGLTCVGQNDEPGQEGYVVKPLNFPLNPSFDEELDLERIFSFQSGAVDFLLKNNFNISEPFTRGVPYLSRDEEKMAKQKAKERQDKSRFDDIELQEDDVETLRFLEKVRGEINEWREVGKSEELTIMSRTLHWKKATTPDLSSFDRRLVHQLVRAEYKDQLMTMGRRDCVIVKEIDLLREARYQRERTKRVRAQIARQTGFRWIIEAITGGSLHGIDIAWFAKDPVDGSDIFFDEQDFAARFNRATAHLKTRRPVLVGHNLFTDLVYLYQSFIGQLPDTVSEFRIRIHDLFPTIVDTKYLATHNCGNINPASSLEQIEETLRTQQNPSIQIHAHHTKYVGKEAFHEAGYDSLLTARVMILLSANLEAAGTYVPEVSMGSPNMLSADEEYDTAPEEMGEEVQGEGPDGNGPTPTIDIPTASKAMTKTKKKSNNRRASAGSRFATKTMFDALSRDDSSPERSLPDSANLLKVYKPSTGGVPMHPAPSEPSQQKRSLLNPTAPAFGAPFLPRQQSGTSSAEDNQDKKVQPLMPPFECDFWRVYANKLRIFGTEERVLDLDPLRMR